jgi:hypothetical protein
MIEFWLDSDGNNDDNDSLSYAVKPYILKAAPATSTATSKRAFHPIKCWWPAAIWFRERFLRMGS